MGIVNGQAVINYRIPMTNYDTVYHEIVHACDPKWRLGTSKSKQGPLGQSMATPHEIDAYIAGKVDEAQDLLDKADPKSKRLMLDELAAWLRKVKSDDEIDSYNVPRIFVGCGALHLYHSDKRLWRRFTSIVWNDLLVKNGY